MKARFHILLYHGVCPDGAGDWPRNSSGKHVSQSQFDAQMRHLSKTRPMVSMDQIGAALRGERSLPDDCVAVTFDDGLGNNASHAWPVLEKYGVPATIYLATGFIGTGRMIWTDRLESAFLDTPRDHVTLTLGGRRETLHWQTTQGRIDAFQAVRAKCKKMTHEEKDRVVEMICGELGGGVVSQHPLYGFMSWQDVCRMDASPLIDFGAHTVDHVALARVGDDEVRRQIDLSIASLSENLSKPCRAFAYPEGQSDDYDDRAIRHLQACGIDYAPTAIEGVNELPGTRPFHLYRYLVGIEGRPYPFAAI